MFLFLMNQYVPPNRLSHFIYMIANATNGQIQLLRNFLYCNSRVFFHNCHYSICCFCICVSFYISFCVSVRFSVSFCVSIFSSIHIHSEIAIKSAETGSQYKSWLPVFCLLLIIIEFCIPSLHAPVQLPSLHFL